MTVQNGPQTGRTALQWAVSFLTAQGWLRDKARLETRLILGKATGRAEIQLVTTLDEALQPQCWELYQDLILRLSQHEPLQYLLGKQEFMGLPFQVTPAVLIPRWDTEVLVEEALRCLQTVSAPKILDLGTGSGAIAISLANYQPKSLVWAVDISPAALAVAKTNAVTLGVEQRITFVEGDLFAPLPAANQFDLILANPPYITAAEYPQLAPEVKKEPYLALVGGQGGLEFYRRITTDATRYLRAKGMLMVEIGYLQGKAVTELFQVNGFIDIRIINDQQGHTRVVVGKSG